MILMSQFTEWALSEVELMIPVTYGYARVSKTDDATRNPETQLHVLQEFGIRKEHIFTGGMTDSSLSRPGWKGARNSYTIPLKLKMRFAT